MLITQILHCTNETIVKGFIAAYSKPFQMLLPHTLLLFPPPPPNLYCKMDYSIFSSLPFPRTIVTVVKSRD